MQLLTSRSRVQNFQRCPRARYWLDESPQETNSEETPGEVVTTYGLEPVNLAVPLVTGGSVHIGLASLLRAFIGSPEQTVSQELIEKAVGEAVGDYQAKCQGRNFALDQLESQSFVYNEQLALVEALVRLAGMRIVPKLLEIYEVLEVEQMDRAELARTSGTLIHASGKFELLFRSIPDALLRNRADGDLYVLSWKTTGEYSSQKDQDARTDAQGLSEPWALEERLGRWSERADRAEEEDLLTLPQWFKNHMMDGGSTRIRGVQMVYLVKGPRRKMAKDQMIAEGATEDQLRNGGAMYKTASPLLYGYMSDKSGLAPQFAWSAEWTCARAHPMRKSQWYPNGECPGDGRTHRRGDEWKSFPVWAQKPPDGRSGVHMWLDSLNSGGVTPEAGDCLDQQWAMPMPHFRTLEAVKSWHRQTKAQEQRVAGALVQIRANAAKDIEFDEILDSVFPQVTEKCANWFNRKCPAWEICHGPSHVAADPLGSGMFRPKSQYKGGGE